MDDLIVVSEEEAFIAWEKRIRKEERLRAVKIVMANIGTVVWESMHQNESIDLTWLYDKLMDKEQ